MKTFIEESIKNIDQEIIEFVESPMFSKFNEIMKQYYLTKLLSFHQDSKNPEQDRQYLQIYLNLAGILKYDSERILEERKHKMEAEEAEEAE